MTGIPSKSMHPPYRDFQQQLDDAFEKNNPDKSVPWVETPPPRWAEQFRPRTIVDIGCATGRFTSAILDRLGRWGCLADLESVILVEEEPGFDCTDAKAIADAVSRCRETIARYTDRNPRILPVNAVAAIKEPTQPTTGSAISVGSTELPVADLLIASHATYYFAESGAALVRALPGSLSINGLAWLVVRKHDCPLYRERTRALGSAGGPVAGDGYAEDIDAVIRSTREIELLETRDLSFLKFEENPSDCVPLAHLLMWRDALNSTNEDNHRVESAERACNTTEPLFSERHFILSRPSGGR